MAKKPKQPQPEEETPFASFEESMTQLSEIVDKLEGGEIPLNDAVALFEQGMEIAKRSQAQLDRVEKRVEELLRVEEDGTPVTRPFD